MKKALILVPGIKGTKLYDSNTIDNDVLWEDIRFNFHRFNDITLSFEHEGKYFEDAFATLAAPLQLEPVAYREFFDCFDNSQYWKFVFPYDWRLPNAENAERLHVFVEYILEKSRVLSQQGAEGVHELTQVEFVTHSMGNFPVRYYTQKYGFSRVGKIVFVAPPFIGSLDAVSALTIGQGFFFNKDETRKMARSLPALFELLPKFEHNNKLKGSGNEVNLFDPASWQKNLVTKDPDNGRKDRSIDKFIVNLQKANERLALLDSWINELTPEERRKILVLAKTEFDTFTSMLIEPNPVDQPENFFNLEDSFYINEGDGVVPNASSCCYFDKIATYALYNKFFTDDKSHAFVMRDSRVQRITHQFLTHPGGSDSFEPELIGRSVKKVTGFETKSSSDGFTYKAIKH